MKELMEMLEVSLTEVPGLVIQFSPELGSKVLLFRDREFAHFHSGSELDLRLTKKVISRLGLVHPSNSAQHPKRSVNSPWIELRFSNSQEISRVVELVKLAIEQI